MPSQAGGRCDRPCGAARCREEVPKVAVSPHCSGLVRLLQIQA